VRYLPVHIRKEKVMKFTKSLVLVVMVSLALGLTTAKRSEALVGGGMALAGGAGVPVMVVGATLLCLGSAGALYGMSHEPWIFGSHPAITMGVLSALLGIVLLDGENGRVPAFQTLDKDQAAKLGVTWGEAETYNGELEELNLVKERIAADMAPEMSADAKVLGTQDLIKKYGVRSDELLDQYAAQGSLSPETMNVVRAIRSQRL
jgi:hypothetical protein